MDREARARVLLQQHLDGPPSERWVRGKSKPDGTPFFSIPGSPPRRPDQLRPIYAVTQRSCTCPDREYNRDEAGHQVVCCHILAVRLWMKRWRAGLIRLVGAVERPPRPATELDAETDWSEYDQSVRSYGIDGSN